MTMRVRIVRKVAVVPFVWALGVAIAWAQATSPVVATPVVGPPGATSAAAPEADDIPLTPDRVFDNQEWLSVYFRVYKVPKQGAYRVGKDAVRISPVMPKLMQLVGEEGDDYLVRNFPLDDKRSPLHEQWLAALQAAADRPLQKAGGGYAVVDQPDVLPPFIKENLTFKRRDAGLPHEGRWQMSFDVADMNGDGRPDLILPPERNGVATPTIMLNERDGSWKPWAGVKWPANARYNYGTVRVADFDGDGHPDIALASHFSKVFIFYGDGKGNFSRVQEMPQSNPKLTSRALAVADFDGDGRPDLAVLTEINLEVASNAVQTAGLVDILLNKPSGWVPVSEGFPDKIAGDWLTTGRIDGDARPDLFLTSRMEGVMDLIFRNGGDGVRWTPIASAQMPSRAFTFCNAVAPLDRAGVPDLVECFEQFSADGSSQAAQACAIFHFHDASGRPTLTPTPQLLFKDTGYYKNVKAVAIGDIDGDGRNDIVTADQTGRVRVFLQLPGGAFYEQRGTGIDLGGADPFDVRIVDLDGDGMGDIVIMAAPGERGAKGGVWVYAPVRGGAKGAAEGAR